MRILAFILNSIPVVLLVSFSTMTFLWVDIVQNLASEHGAVVIVAISLAIILAFLCMYIASKATDGAEEMKHTMAQVAALGTLHNQTIISPSKIDNSLGFDQNSQRENE